MRATVVQQRTDVGTPRIGLEVTTDHHTTLHVTDVQLLSDAFEERSPTPKDTDFIPDRTIDLTVDYGTPVCEGDVTVDDAQVLVHYEQDGTAKTAVLPVAKLGLDLLANLHAGGCAQQQLDAAAAFSYRTPFHRETVDGDLVLVGDLVLKRPADGGSDEKVVVESVFGSVLFQFEATDAPNVLAPGQPSTKVPVLIRGNNRCDPHARSASQQTFVFTVDVRVGVVGRAPRDHRTPHTVAGAGDGLPRRRLLNPVTSRCVRKGGWGGRSPSSRARRASPGNAGACPEHCRWPPSSRPGGPA